MLYSTDEVIKLFRTYKNLMFMAVTGAYEGNAIKYNASFKMIVWHNNNVDEVIELNEDFLKTKWKILSPVYSEITKNPFIKIFEECFALN